MIFLINYWKDWEIYRESIKDDMTILNLLRVHHHMHILRTLFVCTAITYTNSPINEPGSPPFKRIYYNNKGKRKCFGLDDFR